MEVHRFLCKVMEADEEEGEKEPWDPMAGDFQHLAAQIHEPLQSGDRVGKVEGKRHGNLPVHCEEVA